MQLNSRLENVTPNKMTITSSDQNETPLELRVDGKNQNISPTNISHITIDGHYLDIFHQKEGVSEMISIRKPLKEIIEELPKNLFLKIHYRLDGVSKFQ